MAAIECRWQRVVGIVLIVLFLDSTSIAGTRAEVDGNLFVQSGFGGKQVYDGSGDQQMTVYQPVLFVDSEISASTSIGLRGLLDAWSAASDKAYDSATGASGGTSTALPTRSNIAADLGVSTKLWDVKWAPTAGFSTSTSYRSFHGGLAMEKGFAEDNFTVRGSFQHFQDSQGTINPATRRIGIWNDRLTDSTFLGASQILSPSDIVYVGAGYTSQRGALASNQNTVSLNGTRATEVLPDTRNKGIAVVRLVHGFSDYLAGHVDYRFYVDDWGILAHSAEFSLALEPDDDESVLRLFYRFHTQTGTRYYADAFAQAANYMTSDSDLAPLFAHEFGAQGTIELGDVELGGAFVYYVRSNDLMFYIVQASFAARF